MPSFRVEETYLLRDLLISKGWTEDLVNPDFYYGRRSSQTSKRLRLLPFAYRRSTGSKKGFDWIMKKYGFVDHLPITYHSLAEVVPEPNRRYFVKANYGSLSKQITVCQGYDHLVRTLPTLAYQDYVIQHGVERLATKQGRSYSCRVYVLIVRDRAYVYRRLFGALSRVPYNSSSHDLDPHIPDIGHGVRLEITNQLDAYRIRKAVAQVATAFRRETPNLPGTFSLYGVDVLLDQDGKAWLLEANNMASLQGHHRYDDREAVIRSMLHDLYTLVIAPSCLGTVATNGGWEMV